MSGPEFTFTTHPRPTTDDARSIVDDVPAAAVAVIESPPAPVEDKREWDTFLGNLHFLIRYALGRY